MPPSLYQRGMLTSAQLEEGVQQSTKVLYTERHLKQPTVGVNIYARLTNREELVDESTSANVDDSDNPGPESEHRERGIVGVACYSANFSIFEVEKLEHM